MPDGTMRSDADDQSSRVGCHDEDPDDRRFSDSVARSFSGYAGQTGCRSLRRISEKYGCSVCTGTDTRRMRARRIDGCACAICDNAYGSRARSDSSARARGWNAAGTVEFGIRRTMRYASVTHGYRSRLGCRQCRTADACSCAQISMRRI